MFHNNPSATASAIVLPAGTVTVSYSIVGNGGGVAVWKSPNSETDLTVSAPSAAAVDQLVDSLATLDLSSLDTGAALSLLNLASAAVGSAGNPAEVGGVPMSADELAAQEEKASSPSPAPRPQGEAAPAVDMECPARAAVAKRGAAAAAASANEGAALAATSAKPREPPTAA